MIKRYLILLAAAFVFLPSCERQEPQEFDEGGNVVSKEDRFWAVVGQLVSPDSYTADYKGKTFRPAIGVPEDGDESVRVVLVNSPYAAASHYNDIVRANIDEDTRTHTFYDPEVGTLEWNLDGSGKYWATVDVSIAAIPSLRQIVFRSPQQGDSNGSVGDDGSAWYRFGDVIQRQRDGITEYWVCIRPAFGKEGKGDSHWMSVSPLPDENIWPYYKEGKPFTASNGFDYSLPWKVGSSATYMQVLAEMLYAIYFPHEWHTNCTNYSTESMFGNPSGLPIFKDFHVSRLKWHNEAFWTNVQTAWKKLGVCKTVFGITDNEMMAALKSPEGIFFLYDTSSWTTSFSNKPKVYQAQYRLVTNEPKKMNMHSQTLDPVSNQVVTPKSTTPSSTNYPFDIKKEVTVSTPYVVKEHFFGDKSPRWIIRIKSGEELSSSGKWDPQQPIPGFEPVRGGEFYRYYVNVFPEKSLMDQPEISDLRRGVVNDPSSWSKTDFTGDHYYELGDVLKDEDGRKWIVIGVSGGNQQYSPKSPFAELISFEGIQAGSGNAVASNIATKDQAQRAAVWLWFLGKSANLGDNANAQPIFDNIKNLAGVDFKTLTQLLYAQGNNGNIIPLQHFSVAYYEPGSTQQHLLRYVVADGAANEKYTSVWSRYPSAKVSSVDKYQEMSSSQFTTTDIYLQDIANSSKVSSYGDDAVARASTDANASVPRPYRTQPDTRAGNVTNYFYNSSTWTAGTQPVGMWNEPVLFFRCTSIYDRGGEYATVNKEGKQMTVVGKVNLPALFKTSDWCESAWSSQTGVYRRFNGDQSAAPIWDSVWK